MHNLSLSLTHSLLLCSPAAHAAEQMYIRWGYRDVDTLAEVVANYSSAGLPLETLWSDIEYMPKRFWTMEMDECEFGVLGSDPGDS